MTVVTAVAKTAAAYTAIPKKAVATSVAPKKAAAYTAVPKKGSSNNSDRGFSSHEEPLGAAGNHF